MNPSFISPQDEIGATFCTVLGEVVNNDNEAGESNDRIEKGQIFENQ